MLQFSLVASRCSCRLGFSRASRSERENNQLTYVADEEVYVADAEVSVADAEVSALFSLSYNRACRFRQRITAGLCALS